MNDGWIKLHRKIMDSPYWNNAELYKMACYLIMKANHADNDTYIGNTKISVKRGQFITGRYSLGRDLKAKPITAWKRLRVLERDMFCNIKSNNKFSLITIEKYEYYQGSDTDKEHQNYQQNNIKITSKEHQNNTNNNDKNEKNDKNNALPNNHRLLIDFYCKSYENYFKVKPFLNEITGKINIPMKEIMALKRMLKSYGWEKASKWFDIKDPIFGDDRFVNDKWLIKKCFYPSALEDAIISIKFKQKLEVNNG